MGSDHWGPRTMQYILQGIRVISMINDNAVGFLRQRLYFTMVQFNRTYILRIKSIRQIITAVQICEMYIITHALTSIVGVQEWMSKCRLRFAGRVPDRKGHGAKNGVHLGPKGPRWAPCWPHELCYLGYANSLSFTAPTFGAIFTTSLTYL